MSDVFNPALGDTGADQVASVVGGAIAGTSPQTQTGAAGVTGAVGAVAAPQAAAAGPVSIDVRGIQQALVNAGYPLTVDGIWGPRTQAAYDDFQHRRAAGIPQPAAGGPAPGAALTPPAPSPPPPPSPPPIAQPPGPATAPAPSGPRPATGPGSEDELIRQQYGAMAWMLNIPELATILHTAAEQGWTADVLQAAIQNSDWWKAHTQAQIDNEILRDTRPADYEAKVQATIRQIMGAAVKAGITISAPRAREIAVQGLTAGWDDTQFQAAVGDEFHWHPGETFQGQAASSAADMAKTAAAYGVPLSQPAIAEWITAQLQGRATPDDFTAEMVRQSQGRYPWWAKQIGAGQTPFALATPYMQLVAQVYGRDPAAIGLADPDVKAMLGQVDPGTNLPAPMGLYAAEQWLKRPDSPYWTDPANHDALSTTASVVSEVGRAMGVLA